MVTVEKGKIEDKLVDIRIVGDYLVVEGDNLAFVVSFKRNLVTQVRPKLPEGDIAQENLVSYHMKDYISTIRTKSATLKVDDLKKTIRLTGRYVNTPYG